MDTLTSDYNFISEEDFTREITEEISTVGDLFRYFTTAIDQSGVYCGHGSETPYEEALQLVSYALSLDFDDVKEFLNSKLSIRERARAAQILSARIIDRDPTPYITNVAYFANIPFYVDERVIIPRSPIAELIKGKMKDYLPKNAKLGLDMCTGSGCIAIAMAKYLDLSVDAVDISEDALEVCSYNIDSHGLNNIVIPIQSNLFSEINPEVKYDIIVSNPPYVNKDDYEYMPEEFTKEPSLALVSGDDGLDATREILRNAPAYMKDDAYLICEIGNSMFDFKQLYPDVKVEWINFEHGGNGVFAVSRQELLKHKF